MGMRWPLWRVAVAERSMEPALRPGDWLVVRRTMVPGRSLRVRAGQLVVARHPGRPAGRPLRRRGGRTPATSPAAGAVDSRAFGAVPASLIEGRVLLRYWPVRRGQQPAGPAPGNRGRGQRLP